MQVVYVGPDPAVHVVHVSGFEVEAARGVPVDVPDEVAHGTPGSDGHPGLGGLLDQPDNWQALFSGKSTSAGGEVPEPSEATVEAGEEVRPAAKRRPRAEG